MRVGELASIDFKSCPAHRFIRSKLHNEIMAEVIINTKKTKKKREVYIPIKSYCFFKSDKRKLSKALVTDGFLLFRRWANLSIRLTPHVCRRTLATTMHEAGVDIYTIAMVLGNTPVVVMNHYILSSGRNYDAIEIAYAHMNNSLVKFNNMFVNNQ
jgi:site-specific recombinase XerD